MTGKSDTAFRTIGEVSAELGLPQHILRSWETKFTQLRPVTRAGNRRYYRPEDVALVRRIDRALNHVGFTMKGVQRLLAEPVEPSTAAPQTDGVASEPRADVPSAALVPIRDRLRAALGD